MGRSFLKLLGTNLGYRTDHVVTMSVSLAGTRMTPALRRNIIAMRWNVYAKCPGSKRLAQSIRCHSLPGSLAAKLQVGLRTDGENYHGDGRDSRIFPHHGNKDPDWPRFDFADQTALEPVAIVNEEFARLAGEGPALVGKRKAGMERGRDCQNRWHRRKIRYGPESPIGPQLILAAERRPSPSMTLVARVQGKTEAYLPLARAAVQSVDRQVPVFDVKTLDQRLDESLARPRFYTTAVLFFAAFGLLLAVIGVYGVASYSIIQRTHELGVRIAIGASAKRCV